MHSLRSTYAAVLLLITTACGTTMTVHRVEGGRGTGGIPFFMPRAVVSVAQPIEIGRSESLFAVLELDGVQHFLYELDVLALDDAITALRSLIGIPEGTIVLASAEPLAPVMTEQTTTTQQGPQDSRVSTTETRKYTVSETVAAADGKSDALYAVQDPAKALSVVLVPDTMREYELKIDPGLLSSGDVNVTVQDGWRLTALNAQNTVDDQVTTALSSVASAAIASNQAIRVAEIGMAQAVQLARLAQGETPQEVESQDPSAGESISPFTTLDQKILEAARDSVQFSVQQLEFLRSRSANGHTARLRVVGYLKRVEINVMKPGMYDLVGLVENTVDFDEQQAITWVRLSFRQPAAASAAQPAGK